MVMVAVRDFSRRGRSSVKPQKVESGRSEATIENIRHALEKQGIDSTQAFALLEGKGQSTRHASDHFMSNYTQRPRSPFAPVGTTLSWATPELASSPRRSEVVSNADHMLVDDTHLDNMPGRHHTAARRRVFRNTIQRGLSVIPQDATRFPARKASPSPMPPSPVAEDIESESEAEQPARPNVRKVVRSFRIDDEQQVTAFILTRLKRMQQLADKKIAKVWIKGICPKKQAKFPYSNKKRKEETGEDAHIPQWWPELSQCKFTEPDHIKREERMLLCLHLLRLRPTTTQLFEWNNRDTEPNKTHATVGWTAFLKELAGPEIFDDLPREPANKVEQRRKLLNQMYEVAQMEEDLHEGARDGEDMYSYEEDDEDRKASAAAAKRSRQASIASNGDDERSRADSVPAKRRRTDSREDAQPGFERPASDAKPVLAQHDALSAHRHSIPCQMQYGQSARDKSSLPQLNIDCTRQSTRLDEPVSAKPQICLNDMWQQYEQGPGHWVDHGAPAVYSQQCPVQDPYQVQNAPTNFPGRQDYEFPARFQPAPHQLPQHQIHVNSVHHVPQPEFHALPDTPDFSPSTMVPISLSAYTPQQFIDANMQYDSNYISGMPANQNFMPSHSDSAVAEFRPPATVSYHHETQPLMSMHHHSMPHSQPASWLQRC